jgi:hypothetical protein
MLPFSLSAQAPSGNPAAPALKVTTHLVVLGVVVTDKKGYPVTNLSKEDFKVFENEQAQAIATFEPAAEPRIAEGAASAVVCGKRAVLQQHGVNRAASDHNSAGRRSDQKGLWRAFDARGELRVRGGHLGFFDASEVARSDPGKPTA